jgi:hypothetical protein
VIASVLADVYRAAADGYVTARAANESAATAAEVAGDAVRARTTEFDAAFDRWTVSIDAQNARGYAEKELHDDLGGRTLAGFARQPARVKTDRMVTLAIHVAGVPALAGDPAAYAALTVATDALGSALADQEGALRARATTVKALEVATAAFDRAYGELVRIVKVVDPAGLGAQVPKFAREVDVPDAAGAAAASDGAKVDEAA